MMAPWFVDLPDVLTVLEELEDQLVGLRPVKERIREIAAFLVVDRARRDHGIVGSRPTLHMAFTGNPGTGKTTVALCMATVLHRLGHLRRDSVVVASRDDLVGQYVGHTAPKTREVLKRALGGILFIDGGLQPLPARERTRLWSGDHRDPAPGHGE